MTITRTFRRAFSLCFFAIFLSAVSGERPVLAQCEKVTDTQIVSDIYGRLKADKGVASQISHINFAAVNQAVKIQGWTSDKGDYNTVYDIVSNTDCVRVVNVNDFYDAPPADDSSQRAMRGCSTGTKACGDICIPENDACNITGFLSSYQPVEPYELGVEFSIFGAVSACS